ncbi:transketolase family protein [Qiania dongpingensis]|uniref:Transketolase family protein n=1 Tax=Qiania dongpingensis TaxID=2763669 RepID=A0A7G9G733_9FIRM|nr:transketolase C-terminal domain-containing protein [Qiania dongpingensis]QNM06615.1 transketolase family protein [Qiania dongpingensis]
MEAISNRQVICEVLLEAAEEDREIVVVCSDSRDSASLAPFAREFPEQFVETGIAEQNLVAMSAGLAACGKKVFAASPASFLSTRSYEQAKVDVAYSKTNVTLLGISGGVSYGALGMTHHSCQDIAAFCALPDMRVYLPCDRFETKKLIQALLKDMDPAYVRVSRSASEDVYREDMKFILDKAQVLKKGIDVTIIACGEMVSPGVRAAHMLDQEGISAGIIDMYCLKPMDEEAVIAAAKNSKCILTVEEHSPYGGLGSMVAQIVSANCPKQVVNMALPDRHLIGGSGSEVLREYGLTAEGIAARVKQMLLMDGEL